MEAVGQPPVTPGLPGDLYTRTSLLAPIVPEDDHWDVRHNVTAKGFTASSSDTPGFRSVAAPITKPGHVPSGPPPIKARIVMDQKTHSKSKINMTKNFYTWKLFSPAKLRQL